MFQDSGLTKQRSREQALMQKGSIEKAEAGEGYKRGI